MQRRTPLSRGSALLARAAGLQTRTPLARGTGLSRGTPIPRQAPTGKPAKPRKAPTNTGPTPLTRLEVFERDQHRCVACGRHVNELPTHLGYSWHHRQNRGMGGRPGDARAVSNSHANLVIACGSGATGCHGLITTGTYPAARDLGLVIPTNGSVDHATVPILHAVYGWCLLDHFGNAAACDPPSVAVVA